MKGGFCYAVARGGYLHPTRSVKELQRADLILCDTSSGVVHECERETAHATLRFIA